MKKVIIVKEKTSDNEDFITPPFFNHFSLNQKQSPRGAL